MEHSERDLRPQRKLRARTLPSIQCCKRQQHVCVPSYESPTNKRRQISAGDFAPRFSCFQAAGGLRETIWELGCYRLLALLGRRDGAQRGGSANIPNKLSLAAFVWY